MRRPSAGFAEWPVEELELSVGSYNCLKREGVDTIGQLAAAGDEGLMGKLGTNNADEIRAALKEHGRDRGYGA